MKRKLLTLLIGLNSLFVLSQTFQIDPSFESYLIAEGIDSNPVQDSVISFVDAAKTTNIRFELNNLNINNLSGIENFTFLEEIFIYGGSLNLLQLDFSQNKRLKEIDANIPNLSSLIVNGADALERIRVGPTQLTTLDVSQNLELSALSIYGSILTTIDISANTKLRLFVISNTSTLTSSFDFGNNPNLETVVVLNSNLDTLNLTDKPFLGYVDFLDASITSLTIEKAPLLTFANFYNSNIVNLKIENTALTSLDFSTVNSLEILDIRNCLDLTNLELPPANSNLRELTLYASIFNDNDPATQFNYDISNRPSLEKLEIWQSGITNLTIENCSALTNLIVGEHIAGMTELQNLVITNTAITEFNLGNNNAELLNIEIENNPFLIEISTSGNGLSTVERLSVVDNALTELNLSRLSNIETLSVRNNPNLGSLDLTTINNGSPNSLNTFEGENTGIETLDFSTSTNIEKIRLAYNSVLGGVPLNELNLKNGNNTAITELDTSGNYPSLACIQVDAGTVGTSPIDWVKDSQTIYADNCAASPVLVSFILANEENLEDSGTPTPRLLLEGTVTTATTISLFTSSFAANNIADPATDYDLNGGASLEVQIPAGTYDTFTSFLVPGLNISNDNEFEGNEVVFLEAFSNSPELVNASDGALLDQGSLIYSYTILEDDYRANISAGPSVLENEANSSFTISLLDEIGNTVNNDSGRNIEVFFSLTGEAMQFTDYNITGASANNTVIISDNSNSSIITVVPIDDNLYEDGEFIDIQIIAADGYYLDTSVGNLSDSFSILDNDDRISLTLNRIGAEGTEDVEFTISLTDENGNPAINDTSFDIEFDVAFASGTAPNAAILGADFINGIKNSTGSTVVFPTNQSFVNFEVELINDTDPENQENFNASLTQVDQGLGLSLTFINNQAIGLINDNDSSTSTVPVSFIVPNQTDLENNANPTPQLTLNGTVTTATSITLMDVTGSSAIVNLAENSDYSFNNGSPIEILIAAGVYSSNNPIPVPGLIIFSDDDFEGNELLIIEATSNSTELVNGTDGSLLSNKALEYSYTILEDDYRIDIVAGSNVMENGTNGSFTVSLLDEAGNMVSNESGRNIEVSYLDNGDAQQGSDYDLSGSATILNNQNATDILVNAIDDNLFEGEEFLELEIVEGEGYYLNSVSSSPKSALSLLDNDNRITFRSAGIGTEGGSSVVFAISLGDENGNPALNAAPFDIEFDVKLTSGTAPNAAISGTDFIDGIKNTPNGTVVFPINESTVNFEVELIDDTDPESQENFIATITKINQGIGIVIENDQAIGLINDNDNTIADTDNDGIVDTQDNCPNSPNPDQANLDNDSLGDMCDPDIDGDGVANDQDIFPRDNSESLDNDNDGIGDNTDSDDDNDGVPDLDDDCQFVPGVPAENGCPVEITTLDQEAFQLIVTSETCEGVENGSFEVTIDNEDYTFTVSLDGNAVGSANYNNPFEQNNLASGSYQVCLTVPELPEYEQCFGIVVSTYERLAVDVSAIDAINLKASFNVQGSKNYEALVNDNIYRFQFENASNKILEIPINKGQNLVSITGESDCQGIFKDVIVIGNVAIFPNPVKDILNFSGFELDGQAQINVFTISGSLVKTIHEQIENGDITVLLPDLPKGIYLFKVVSGIEIIEFKIIKE